MGLIEVSGWPSQVNRISMQQHKLLALTLPTTSTRWNSVNLAIPSTIRHSNLQSWRHRHTVKLTHQLTQPMVKRWTTKPNAQGTRMCGQSVWCPTSLPPHKQSNLPKVARGSTQHINSCAGLNTVLIFKQQRRQDSTPTTRSMHADAFNTAHFRPIRLRNAPVQSQTDNTNDRETEML